MHKCVTLLMINFRAKCISNKKIILLQNKFSSMVNLMALRILLETNCSSCSMHYDNI